MDEKYDYIVLGTGLKECILSGLLSVEGKKVLTVDENEFYGGESTSLNLEQLWEKSGQTGTPDAYYGKPNKWFVDACPKFIMADGNLVKMLLGTKVTRYIEFRSVGGSFVYKEGKVQEVPTNPKAVAKSGLMGMFQKKRFKNFLEWVLVVDGADRSTWGKRDLKTLTMKEVYDSFKLEENTIDLAGHAIALYHSDDYLHDPRQTIHCIKRLKLYYTSLVRYGTSPYLYPKYGLGTLPEGFSRIAAVHGATYMMRRKVKQLLYDSAGRVRAVVTSEGTAKLKEGGKVIASPSYFLDTLKSGSPKITRVGQCARWLCILTGPVPNTRKAESAQIIISAKQCKRQSDIYISVMNKSLAVVPKEQNYYIAMISSNVYTDNPKKELSIAFELLGKVNVLKEFLFVSDLYMPINDPRRDSVFIPSSMDATTHFEEATTEVEQIYAMITGKRVDLSANTADIDEED